MSGTFRFRASSIRSAEFAFGALRLEYIVEGHGDCLFSAAHSLLEQNLKKTLRSAELGRLSRMELGVELPRPIPD
jgi:hypothetical protein